MGVSAPPVRGGRGCGGGIGRIDRVRTIQIPEPATTIVAQPAEGNVGEGAIGEGNHAVPSRHSGASRSFEEANRAIERARGSADDGPGDDVALERGLLSAGKIPFERWVGHYGDEHVRMLSIQVDERLMELGQREGGPPEARDHPGVDEHKGRGGHG